MRSLVKKNFETFDDDGMFEWVVCVKSHLMLVIECEIKTVSFAIF